MPEPEPGMTYAEYLESIIPKGNKCWGCGNIDSENGCCTTWRHEVTTNTKKCKECLSNKYLDNIRKMRKALEEKE